MSTTPDGPEYLDASGPIEPAQGNENRKRMIVVGALVGVGAIVAGGAWAASSFFSTGSQPAQALPDSTIAYFGVDLDPSGGQKIEAIKTLRKFPGFSDNVTLDTDDDLRERLFEEITKSGECKGLDYAKDVEPWLGSRGAIAAVDLGEEKPSPVGVVQVSDAGKAEEGVAKLIKTCGEDSDAESSTGWVVEGDWLVVAETEKIAQDVVAAAGKTTLADDGSFAKWTSEAGDDGFMSIYVAKAAAQYLDQLEGLTSPMGSALGAGSDDPFADEDPFADDGASTPVPDELKQLIDGFDGMAATVRFDDGSVEIEYAVSNYQDELTKLVASDVASELVEGLPADTVAALGLGLNEGWFEGILDYVKSTMPEEADSIDESIAQFEEETGLSLPEDIETLMGDGVVVAVGGGIDVDAISNGGAGEVPVGIKIKGDADEIQAVLDKLKDMAGPEAAEYLEVTDADGDAVLGLQEEFVKDLASKDGLGDDKAYQKVVEGDDAQSILYINFNADDNWLVRVSKDSPEISENLDPLAAFGLSSWIDDDVVHGLFKLTTD